MKPLILATIFSLNTLAYDISFKTSGKVYRVKTFNQMVNNEPYKLSFLCKKKCLATAALSDKKKCSDKQKLSGIYKNGDFATICYFQDKSFYILY